jgi:dTDP-4-dehydrorhamnose reductase
MPGMSRLDLRDGSAVKKLIHDIRPKVCYLPGALTFVDYAESHSEECRQTNVLGVSEVARAIAEVTGLLVFFSTEHVFAESTRPWKEDDPVFPQSVYAKSKAEAEQIVRETLPDHHLILRTSWVFGRDPQEKNFLWRVRRTLEKGEQLFVPSDQHGQPTYGPDLARTARLLVQRGARGTYHVVGPQYLSRLAWARLIAETLHLPSQLIQGHPTHFRMRTEECGVRSEEAVGGNVLSSIPHSALPIRQSPVVAPRPLHIRLDRSKLLALLGHDPIRSPQAAIEDMG